MSGRFDGAAVGLAAFQMWEAAVNISFREASKGERANILIGAQAEPQG